MCCVDGSSKNHICFKLINISPFPQHTSSFIKWKSGGVKHFFFFKWPPMKPSHPAECVYMSMYNSVYIPGDTRGVQLGNTQQQQQQLGSTARAGSPHAPTPATTPRLHSNAIRHASATTVLDPWQLRTFEELGGLCWFCRGRLRSAAWLGGGRAGAGNCRA